jgi:hypothetical protein
LTQSLFGALEGSAKPLQLGGNRFVRNDSVWDVRYLPPEEVDRPDGDAG